MASLSLSQERIKICAKTDPGVKRRENEDCFLIIDGSEKHYDTKSKGMLFAVADGMSGHKGGAIASRMACEGLLAYYDPGKGDPNNVVESKLKIITDIFYQIHLKIKSQSLKEKAYERMGTTLSVLVYLNNTALIAHAGDSRIYRLRNHFIEQLTHDHTMAQLSVEMGYIKQEDTENNPLRHVLLNVVGQGLDEVQASVEKVEEGDIFLLCTDGLHHAVKDDQIGKILESFPRDDRVCDRLIQEAIKGGSKDNITSIAVSF